MDVRREWGLGQGLGRRGEAEGGSAIGCEQQLAALSGRQGLSVHLHHTPSHLITLPCEPKDISVAALTGEERP
jgi:hypothetical protein